MDETSPNQNETYLRPEDVLKIYPTTTNRLAKQRNDGTGPPFTRDGRRVLYRLSAVLEYLQERELTRAPANHR